MGIWLVLRSALGIVCRVVGRIRVRLLWRSSLIIDMIISGWRREVMAARICLMIVVGRMGLRRQITRMIVRGLIMVAIASVSVLVPFVFTPYTDVSLYSPKSPF